MSKWVKVLLALSILAFLLWYLARHWEELKVLLKLGPKQLIIMYLSYFVVALSNARVVQCLVNALKTRTRFWDMALVTNTAVLLNYAPMKIGTLFRADYLKRHYGLSYTHFATFFLYITFLMTAIAAAVGWTVLVTVYSLTQHESKILAGVFAATLVGSLFILFLQLPLPKGQGRFSTTVRSFLSARSQISKARKALFTATAFVVLNFLLTALRIGIVYHSMGKNIHPAGYLVLGALDSVVLFIGLTPGSLGIRELVLSFGAVVLGVPLEVGILAAMIDRAVIMSYTFVVGGGCALWLWRKCPTDFRQNESDMLPQTNHCQG